MPTVTELCEALAARIADYRDGEIVVQMPRMLKVG